MALLDSPRRGHRRHTSAILLIVLIMLASATAIGVALDGLPITAPDLPTEALVAMVLLVLLALLGGSAYLYLRASVRLKQLVRFIDEAEPHAYLERIPKIGGGEIGEVCEAINRLLARMTRLSASFIDQGRELEETQAQLKLKAALAAKSRELELHLEERAMVFDMLRLATSSPELDVVLHNVVQQAGTAMRLREVAIFIEEGDVGYAMRAAYGFRDEEVLLGKTLKPGEGIAGEVGRSRASVLIEDVSRAPSYLGFWGEAEREGAMAAVPIIHQDRVLGVLTATRQAESAITRSELHILEALADQAALAIRNAQLYERMRDLSTHDELTGLANRRLLRHQLEMEMDRARRFSKPLSVVAIDIDHFKQLNDQHGHPTGDVALRGVARTLASGVRKLDTVGRMGGEEFVLLLPRADLHEATQVCEKLKQLVSESEFPGGRDQPTGCITISLGVTSLRADDDEQGESLIARADRALYDAKRQGRNRVAPQV